MKETEKKQVGKMKAGETEKTTMKENMREEGKDRDKGLEGTVKEKKGDVRRDRRQG